MCEKMHNTLVVPYGRLRVSHDSSCRCCPYANIPVLAGVETLVESANGSEQIGSKKSCSFHPTGCHVLRPFEGPNRGEEPATGGVFRDDDGIGARVD
jgi:hypothetical protein